MAKQNEWSKIVTPRIKGNMGESARAAYQNGCALHDDALLLFDGERFPRSAALAILAEEEFSKAFILFISVNQGRWDSNIYKALRQHPQKQGIAEGMRAHFDWFVENLKRVMEINRSSPIQHQPSSLPDAEKMNEIIQTAKSNFSKPVRDYFKQDSLYVSFDEDARLKSIPASIGREDAQRYLAESAKFKAITAAMLGEPAEAAKLAGL